jgi:hypothetical protein
MGCHSFRKDALNMDCRIQGPLAYTVREEAGGTAYAALGALVTGGRSWRPCRSGLDGRTDSSRRGRRAVRVPAVVERCHTVSLVCSGAHYLATVHAGRMYVEVY